MNKKSENEMEKIEALANNEFDQSAEYRDLKSFQGD